MGIKLPKHTSPVLKFTESNIKPHGQIMIRTKQINKKKRMNCAMADHSVEMQSSYEDIR